MKENSFKAGDVGGTYESLLTKAAKHVKVYSSKEEDFTAGDIVKVTVNGNTEKAFNATLDLKSGTNQIYIGNVVVKEIIEVNGTDITVPVTYTVNRTFTITN